MRARGIVFLSKIQLVSQKKLLRQSILHLFKVDFNPFLLININMVGAYTYLTKIIHHFYLNEDEMYIVKSN